MIRKKEFIIFILISLIFTSCVNTTPKNIEEPKVEENVTEIPLNPTRGGEINISMRNPKTLNPLLNEDYTVDQILKLVFDTLITFDKNQKPAPNLASGWSFSEDGTMLTLNIRQDVMWHDGTPFTAKDVKFSLDTIKESSDTSAYKKCIQNITSYMVVDDYTIKIIYNQPFSGSLYGLYFPIIPAHIYENNTENAVGDIIPVGTGRYKVADFLQGKELNLVVNDNWFKGAPYIEKINVLITPDSETDMYSFEQEILDVIITDVVDWDKYAQNQNIKIHEYVTNYYDFIGFNFNKALFQDKNIRQAIAYAIDRESILENYYLNHGVITDVPINPESWLYSEESRKYNFDIEKAKELLGDKNVSFNLLVSIENEIRKEVAYEIQNMLKEVGINIEIEEVSQQEFINRLQTKNFDAFLGGWKLSPIPDYTFAFHSSEIEEGTNYISFRSDTMDNLIKQTFVAIKEEDIKSAYDNLQKFIAEELPYVSLYFRTAALITNDKIQGEINPNKDFYMNNIEDWFVYEEDTNNITNE
ncbi:ABC transporter substrate-binding protein [Defluviitalea phaphyphila]|uniref:ABC transporter substrate-binding protein n=1 Tax=Defluviitalea phaphyphila TaxID=1473580 RepID=UPI000730BCC7|nr:peptide ABC transporter substrate-binding protein [Defluviitalea phaphyphila]